MNFQQLILNLQKYWGEQGCVILQPYDLEKGAGTMNPATFLRALGRQFGNFARMKQKPSWPGRILRGIPCI